MRDGHTNNTCITYYLITVICQEYEQIHAGFEVFTAVIMKNAVFWNVALRDFIINRRFGGTSPRSSGKNK
jgi:hypothetical protein